MDWAVVQENVNTAATVLGYPVLALALSGLLWVGALMMREVFRIVRHSNYERWQQDREMRNWDNFESSWALDIGDEERNTTYDTDVEYPIPGLAHEQVYDQSKEQ